jgi:hypothetical protein
MKKWILPITLLFVIAVIVLATYHAGSDKIQIVHEEHNPENRVNEKPLLPTPTPANLNNSEEQIKIDTPPSELHAQVQIDSVTQTAEVTIALWTKDRQTCFQMKQFQVTGEANCIVENVQWPNTYLTIASASGFISSQQVAESYDDSIILKLFTQPILELSVVSDTNAPVPGAQIDIRSNSNGIYSSLQKTDDQGQLRMSLPFTGEYHLSVTHPLYTQSIQKDLDIYYNPNHHKIAMTNRTGWIFGQVYDENQKPIPQQSIALYQNRRLFKEILTNPEGRYEFINLPFDRFDVKIQSCTGYLRSDIKNTNWGKIDSLKQTAILSPEQPQKQIDFTLTPAYWAKGIVKNRRDRPIPDAQVMVSVKGLRETSLRPVSDKQYTNEKGEYFVFLNQRSIDWSQLTVYANHPRYNTGRASIKQYSWNRNLENLDVVLDDPITELTGRILEESTMKPFATEFQLVRTSWQRDPTAFFTIASNEQGYFRCILPDGPYLASATGYQVVFPPRIDVMRDATKDVEIQLRKTSQESMKIVSGTVLSAAGDSLIPSAHISIGNQEFFSANGYSDKKGKFSISIPDSMVLETCQLSIYHRNFKAKTIPLDQIESYENVLIYLEEYKGSIHVSLTGADSDKPFKVYLQSQSKTYDKEITRYMDGREGWIQKIDPEYGPFCVLAGNEDMMGISPTFDLRNDPSCFYYAIVPLADNDLSYNLSIRVIDSTTKKPVVAVQCALKASTMNPYKLIKIVSKNTITGDSGAARFQQIPLTVGSIRFRHGLYESKTVELNQSLLSQPDELVVSLNPLVQSDKQ